ncbi:MAG: peroxiredoxin [Planctomycetes bacterium]|nr:peroxiredoxin [Planctomycetota bacterium]
MQGDVMSLIGQKAPAFKADALVGNEFKNLSLEDYRGKWTILFFYPLNFTFVCPTEITGFQDRLSEFRELGAEVIAVSVDSKFSHLAWNSTPRTKGGLGGIQYPLVADLNKEISRSYDVLLPSGVALRGLFLIDPDGTIQHSTINNLSVGRNVDETLRVLRAFQTAQKTGDVCPMNWTPGKDTMTPNPKGAQAWFERHGK